MRAVVLESYGGPEVLDLQEVPDPMPGPEELIVEVVSTALNRADLSQGQGNYPGPVMEKEIPGLEVAGRVGAVGERVSLWSPGAEVMCIVGGGAYASRIAVHERLLMPVPSSVPVHDAAAIPEAWITAWDAMVLQGGLTSGRLALVHAGASGVGTAAIQLAKAIGARIIVTCSGPKVARCEALGADLAIDYREEDYRQAVDRFTEGEGVDVVVDVVGGDYVERNLQLLRTGGRVVQVGSMGQREATISLATLQSKRASLIGTRLRSRPLEEKILLTQRFTREVLPLFERPPRGRPACEITIDRRYPIAQIAEAHRYMESNASIGKILIDVAETP